MFDQTSLYNFEKLTKFSVSNLLNDFVIFIAEDYLNIVNYYSGDIKTPNSKSFDNLFRLQREAKLCLDQFQIYKKAFNNFKYWELLNRVQDIKTKLDTIENIGFYSNSNINKNQFNTNIESDKVLKQNETLESFVGRELLSLDRNNDWVDIALYNNLSEEKYSYDGKKILKVVLSNNNQNYIVENVLGKLQGELLYGIDLNKQFKFDNNDIAVLTPKDTIRQAINILINLERGDNPQYPNNGLSSTLFVGNSIAGLAIPILFRQLSANLGRDDTIFSFSIIDMSTEGDSLRVDFEIQTKFGEVYNEKIIL